MICLHESNSIIKVSSCILLICLFCQVAKLNSGYLFFLGCWLHIYSEGFDILCCFMPFIIAPLSFKQRPSWAVWRWLHDKHQRCDEQSDPPLFPSQSPVLSKDLGASSLVRRSEKPLIDGGSSKQGTKATQHSNFTLV